MALRCGFTTARFLREKFTREEMNVRKDPTDAAAMTEQTAEDATTVVPADPERAESPEKQKKKEVTTDAAS